MRTLHRSTPILSKVFPSRCNNIRNIASTVEEFALLTHHFTHLGATIVNSVGVAIVGLGHMGRMYARLLDDMPEFHLTGVYDVQVDAAEEIADAHAVRTFGSLDELLDDPHTEGVLIAVPDRHHAEPTIKALAADKHVFLEKPLATTLADGTAMVEAASSAQGNLLVAHTLRFDPRYAAARASILGDELGEVIHVYTRRNSWLSASGRVAEWSTLPFFLGIHDIDMLHWVLGERIVSVYARSAQKVMTSNHDTVLVSVRFESGAIGTIELSWALPDVQGNRRSPTLEIVGTKGYANVILSDQGVSIHTQEGVAIPDFWYGFAPALHGHMLGVYREELLHFWRCVRTREEPIITPAQALEAVRVALAVESSLASNNDVPVEY